jgi:hypothetical protein
MQRSPGMLSGGLSGACQGGVRETQASGQTSGVGIDYRQAEPEPVTFSLRRDRPVIHTLTEEVVCRGHECHPVRIR